MENSRPLLYRFADQIVASDRPFPELPEAVSPAQADIVLTHARDPIATSVRWFQTWSAGGGPVRFGRTGAGYVVAFDEVASVLISPDAGRVLIAPVSGAEDFRIRHLLLHQILPLALSRRGRFVLHASAVSWRDRVIAFAGRTGAGKSTIAAACAAAGAALVSDDSLVLDRDPAGWRVVPVYPGVRLRTESYELLFRSDAPPHAIDDTQKVLLTPSSEAPAFESRVLPLDRILLVSLDAGPETFARVLGAEAAVALASQLFRLDVEDVRESRRLFDLVTDLAVTAPVARLSLQPGGAELGRMARRVLALGPENAENTPGSRRARRGR